MEAEEVKKLADERSAGRFDSPVKPGIDIFRPKPGENWIRILPPHIPGTHYSTKVIVHRFVGADKSTYLCLAANGKKGPCPICDAAEDARRAGESDDAKQLRAADQYWCWVVDRDETKPKPMLYQLSRTMDGDIIDQRQSKRSGKVLNIDHPDEGYDVIIKRSGKALNTKYKFMIDRDQSPLDEDDNTRQGLLDFVDENAIASTFKFYPPEYLEKVMSGTAADRDADLDDEDDAPPRRSSRAKADEDEEIPFEPDEKPRGRRGREEDEEPVPLRTRARRAAEPEEEDEPAPVRKRGRAEPEEETEDEPPARTRRARATEPEEDEPPARRSRRAEPDEEEADEPPVRRGRRVAAAEDDDEPAPARKRTRAEPEEDEPPVRRGRARAEPEEEADEPPARTRRARAEPEEEADEPPARTRRARAEPEEDEPPARSTRPRRAAAVEEEELDTEADAEEDEAPARRRRAA